MDAFHLSPVAQLAEQAPVKRKVTGSRPVEGAQQRSGTSRGRGDLRIRTVLACREGRSTCACNSDGPECLPVEEEAAGSSPVRRAQRQRRFESGR